MWRVLIHMEAYKFILEIQVYLVVHKIAHLMLD